MPREAIKEIADFLKPGGHFVTAMREFYYSEEETEMRYYSMLQEMMESGKLKLVTSYKFKRGLSAEQNTSGNPLFGEFTSVLLAFQKQ